jgi:hypothetical protein
MSAGAERAALPPQGEDEWLVSHEEAAPLHGQELVLEEEIAADPPERGRPLLAAVLILLIVGWLGACAIVLYRTADQATLLNVVSWIATMSVPPALIALIWLIFGRTRRAETERFTRAVQTMRAEAESLDKVLGIVADRLATNRIQLSDEAARLMKLGEEASDRLGRVTHYLSREATDLDRKSQAVEGAAAQARVDIGVLLADLPQAEQAARSFSDTVREAGVTAHERSLALEAQLSAIAARAQDADAATGGAAERLSAHIARIGTSAGVAAQELDGVAARLDASVDAALGRTTEAVDATRVALDAQAQGLFASIEQGRARFAEAGADAARQLNERLEAMRIALEGQAQALFSALDESHGRFTTVGADASTALSARLAASRAEFDEQAQAMFGSIEQQRAQAAEASVEANRQLMERLEATRAALETQSQALLAAVEESHARFSDAGADAGAALSQRLATARSEFDEQARAMFAAIEQSRTQAAAAGADANRQLMERLHATRELVETISTGLAGQEQTSRELVTGLAGQIAALDERLAALGQRTDGQSAQMATALASLRDGTATLRQEVDATTEQAVALIGRTGDMAGALESVGEKLRADLPPALAEMEARAAAMRDVALSAGEPVRAMAAAASEGAARLTESQQLVAQQQAAVDALLASIGEGAGTVEQRLRELTAAATEAGDASSTVVRETGPELIETLVRVREAARAAAGHAREAIGAVIPESAASLTAAINSALGDAVTKGVREQIDELEGSAGRAAAAARTATERLTRQMLALGEGAAALERKVEEERALREQQDRDGSSRRVALLIESLNSTAIDVTKILSNEVTDSAWQAYLKGDRSVFTRRAVRLLESGEAREIMRHYDQELEFREQVNRYIADFEAMLRRVLSEPDGNALAVTLLSADMGKLYVALAQAIQHLRV